MLEYARSFILDRTGSTAKNVARFQSALVNTQSLGFSSPCAAEYRVGLSKDTATYMAWTAPYFEEIQLNCEINSYSSARL